MTASHPSEFVQFCVEYSTIALLYYDYNLTLIDEISLIWNKQYVRRFTTVLYILCRYALVSNVIYVLTLGDVVHGSCDLGYRLSAGIGILGRLAVLIVWGMRTYAVWHGNRFVAVWLLVLGLGCISTNVVTVFITRCDWQDSIPQ